MIKTEEERQDENIVLKIDINDVTMKSYYYYLIKSRYKTIHQIMYKTKDKERKKRMKARLLYT